MTCTTRKERAKREGLEDPQDPQCTLGSALHGMLPFIVLTGRRPVTRLRLKRETIPSLVKSSVSSHVKHSHCPRAGGDGPRREYSFFPDRGGRGGHAHVEFLKGREEGVGSRPGQRLRPGSPRPSRLPGLAPPAGRGPVGPLPSRAAVLRTTATPPPLVLGPRPVTTREPYAGHGRGGRANKIPPRRPESHLVPKPRSPAGTTHAALATFGLSVHLERAATFPPTCSTGIDAGLSVHMKEPATLPPGGADMPGPAGIKYACMALTRCAAPPQTPRRTRRGP